MEDELPEEEVDEEGDEEDFEEFLPQTDEEAFLFAPTEKPDQDMLALNRAPPPEGIEEWIDMLAEMAAEPGAPPAVRAAFDLLMLRLRSSETPI
jgi:hypothetical protein